MPDVVSQYCSSRYSPTHERKQKKINVHLSGVVLRAAGIRLARYLIVVRAIRAVKTAYVRDSNCAYYMMHLWKRDMIARLLTPFLQSTHKP